MYWVVSLFLGFHAGKTEAILFEILIDDSPHSDQAFVGDGRGKGVGHRLQNLYVHSSELFVGQFVVLVGFDPVDYAGAVSFSGCLGKCQVVLDSLRGIGDDLVPCLGLGILNHFLRRLVGNSFDAGELCTLTIG